MFKDPEQNLIKELMSLPTQNYWVKFTYSTKKNQMIFFIFLFHNLIVNHTFLE